MDNMITGILSVGLFISFVAGLAESIGAVPFIIIVALVSIMVLVDLVQSIKQSFVEKNKNARE